MPFIKIVPMPCHCLLPKTYERVEGKKIGLGSEWKCDDCGKVYRLEDRQRDGRYWAIKINAAGGGK